MPTKHQCSFCGREFLHGEGLLYVRKDGIIQWFCSRKCRIYMLVHKKDPRKLKWTKYYGKTARK
jgi:large subunit ribosomal protein L24e